MTDEKEARPSWEKVGAIPVDGDALESLLKLTAMLLAQAVMRHTGNTVKLEKIDALQGHEFYASGIMNLAHIYKDSVEFAGIDVGVLPFLLELALELKGEEGRCTNRE